MTSPVQITDHAQRAIDNLIEQYFNKPNALAIQASITRQIQLLEDELFKLLQSRRIDSAICSGIYLDRIGAFIREPRKSRSDDDYKLGLKLMARAIRSFGQSEDIIDIARIGVPLAMSINFQPSGVCTYKLTIDQVTTAQALQLLPALKRATAAAYRGIFEYSPNPLDETLLGADYDTGTAYNAMRMGDYQGADSASYGVMSVYREI